MRFKANASKSRRYPKKWRHPLQFLRYGSLENLFVAVAVAVALALLVLVLDEPSLALLCPVDY
jgi:hypothetical protein